MSWLGHDLIKITIDNVYSFNYYKCKHCSAIIAQDINYKDFFYSNRNQNKRMILKLNCNEIVLQNILK